MHELYPPAIMSFYAIFEENHFDGSGSKIKYKILHSQSKTQIIEKNYVKTVSLKAKYTSLYLLNVIKIMKSVLVRDIVDLLYIPLDSRQN